jgi:shikimate kinase
MNIILTGMRGSGKSHYGKALAKLLGWKFLDTDEEIEKREGKSINEIIQKNGWNSFRKLETDLCKDIAGNLNLDEYVISTGGGLIIDRENEQLLKQNGKVIFLYRSLEKCAEFILKSFKKDQHSSITNQPQNRPSLTNRNVDTQDELLKELEETWTKRERRYRESADLIVDTSNPTTTPEHILELLQNLV